MELAGAVWADPLLGALALVRCVFQTNDSISGAHFAPVSGEKHDNCDVLNLVSLQQSGGGSGVLRMSGDS